MSQVHPRIIICSGFSYSGSSALVDWLLDHEAIKKFPGGELRLFRTRHGFNGLYSRLRRNGSLTAEDILNLEALLAGEAPVDVPATAKANRNAVLLRDFFGREWDAAADRLVRSLAAKELKQTHYRAHVREFMETLQRIAAMKLKVETLVLDQALRPWLISRRRLLGDPYVFAVHRDLRDQYLDMVDHGYTPPEDFGEMIAKRLARAHAAAKKANAPGDTRCWVLPFERFVLDASLRSGIATELGIVPKPRGEQRFRPEDSAKNIGLHRRRNEHQGLAALALNHPELLWREAD